MENDKNKKAGSAEEARKNETPSGEPTLIQDTGPKNQDSLKGDDTVDDETGRLEGNDIEDADAEHKGMSRQEKD